MKTQYEHIWTSLSKIYCNTSLGSQIIVKTQYMRKEEEAEEEEERERSWRCARKTRTPHKGCGEKTKDFSSL